MEEESRAKKFQYIATGISVILVPLIIGYYGNQLQVTMQEKELKVNEIKLQIEKENNKNLLSKEFIKIALNILKEKPSKNNQDVRSWAVETINTYSTNKLNQKTKDTLIKDIPLNTQESFIYSLTGEYKFKWNGNPKNGYDLEVQYLNSNNKWDYYGGRCLIGNEITLTLPKNKVYRWRVIGNKGTSTEWLFIQPNSITTPWMMNKIP